MQPSPRVPGSPCQDQKGATLLAGSEPSRSLRQVIGNCAFRSYRITAGSSADVICVVERHRYRPWYEFLRAPARALFWTKLLDDLLDVLLPNHCDRVFSFARRKGFALPTTIQPSRCYRPSFIRPHNVQMCCQISLAAWSICQRCN